MSPHHGVHHPVAKWPGLGEIVEQTEFMKASSGRHGDRVIDGHSENVDWDVAHRGSKRGRGSVYVTKSTS